MTARRRLPREEARGLWRYAIDTDFHSIDPTNENRKQILGHGTENRFLPFDHPVEKTWFVHSINSSGNLLAIPDGKNVDIYDIETGDRTVLIGHISEVRSLVFSPTDPNLLVSWSETELRPNDRHPEYNDIILWNVEAQKGVDRTLGPRLIDNAAKAGVEAVVSTLGSNMRMSMGEKWDMRTLLRAIITRNETRSHVPTSSRLDGRIVTSYHSSVFSNSGGYLIYLPGPLPSYGEGESWDICLYDLATRQSTILSGHKKAIDWIRFSPDDSLIASAGRDRTTYVHNVSGQEVWKWRTGTESCGAVFSPDGEYLAELDSSGVVRIWNLKSGEETTKCDNGLPWFSTIDWSPDGKFVVVGSQNHGALRLFATSEGKLEMLQERKLSMDRCIFETPDPLMRQTLARYMSVHTPKFLLSSEGYEASLKLSYSVRLDEGIEVFDFVTGKGWRFVPPYNEDGSTQFIQAAHGEAAICGPTQFIQAAHGEAAICGHLWRKEKGEIGIIAPDGVRFWRLE